MKIKIPHRAAFTLTEVMIVVGIIGLLGQMLIPNIMRARTASQTSVCIENLRQIDSAKQQWGLDKMQILSAVPTESDLEPYLQRTPGATLNITCPADTQQTFETSYDVADLQTVPACLIDVTNHVLPP